MATKRTTFSESNINVSNNTSSLTINVYFSAQNSTTFFDASVGVKLYCTCNGITQNKTVAHPRGGSVNTSFTFNNITHNTDGTKTVSWNWTCTTPTSGLGTQSDSGTKALTTIPRASSFTVANAIVGENTTINITRANSSFKHTLNYTFGTLTGKIAENIDTSASWKVPTDFYKQMPNKTGTCKITCITYNGTTKIGETTKDVTVSCKESDCIPDLTATIVDVNSSATALTGSNTKLIKYFSTARITPTATAKNNATISKITVDNVVTTTYRDILNVNNNSFVVTATDSRGYSKAINITADMINYVQLTCNATIKRTSQTGGIVALEFSGNYFNGSFGSATNNLTMSWSYREKGTTSWTKIGDLTPTFANNTFKGSVNSSDIFDYQKNYEFMISVSDKISAITINNISIYKSVPLLAIASDDVLINGKSFQKMVNDIILERDEKKHPIGSLEFNVSGTNPSEYFGFGTWELWGAGRVPVCIDTSSTEFKTVEQTGGEKKHTLTEAEMPKHRHNVVWSYKPKNAASGSSVMYVPSDVVWQENSEMYTTYAGSSTAHNILQPYITCYMWKRKA